MRGEGLRNLCDPSSHGRCDASRHECRVARNAKRQVGISLQCGTHSGLNDVKAFIRQFLQLVTPGLALSGAVLQV